jgi:hypothetical protein
LTAKWQSVRKGGEEYMCGTADPEHKKCTLGKQPAAGGATAGRGRPGAAPAAPANPPAPSQPRPTTSTTAG